MNQNITNSQEAINLLIQAANKAQSLGAFTLGEAAVLNNAILFLTTPKEVAKEEEIPQQAHIPGEPIKA